MDTDDDGTRPGTENSSRVSLSQKYERTPYLPYQIKLNQGVSKGRVRSFVHSFLRSFVRACHCQMNARTPLTVSAQWIGRQPPCGHCESRQPALCRKKMMLDPRPLPSHAPWRNALATGGRWRSRRCETLGISVGCSVLTSKKGTPVFCNTNGVFTSKYTIDTPLLLIY